MKIGQQLEGTKSKTLILRPATAKKDEKKTKRRDRKDRKGNTATDFNVEDELWVDQVWGGTALLNSNLISIQSNILYFTK